MKKIILVIFMSLLLTSCVKEVSEQFPEESETNTLVVSDEVTGNQAASETQILSKAETAVTTYTYADGTYSKATFEMQSADKPLEIVTYGMNTNNEVSGKLDELSILLEQYGDNVGFCYYNFDNDCSIEYNADKGFEAGSMIKAPFIKSLLADGIDRNAEYEMTEELLNSESELINGKPVGTFFTAEELIYKTLVSSDNTSYKMLYKQIGYQPFNKMSEFLGLPQTMTDENYWFSLSAKQTAVYFKDIYFYIENGKDGRFLKDCMINTDYNELIGKELTQYTIAQKYGYMPYGDHYFLSNCAIVYSESPYILSIYTAADGSKIDVNIFHKIARLTDDINNMI